MSRSLRYASPAIAMRVRPFGETSQVVHLATPDHGMVAVLVKGRYHVVVVVNNLFRCSTHGYFTVVKH